MTTRPGDGLADALQVMGQHQDGACPECTPTDCPAERTAGLTVFDAVAACAALGRTSLGELRTIADGMRGLARRTERISMVVHRVKAGEKKTKCGETVKAVRESPTEGLTHDAAKVTCDLCR